MSLLTGLVAYYRLDEASGNAIDAHGTHDGVDNNGVGTFTPGKLSATARSFGGVAVAEYFSVPDDPEIDFTTQMTVSGWLRGDDFVAQQCMMAKWPYVSGGAGQESWAFQTHPSLPGSGAFRVFIGVGTDPGNNYKDYAGVSLANDTWYYATLVYDGSQVAADRLKVYLNAVRLTPTTEAGVMPASLQVGNGATRIGDFQNLNRYWVGQLQGWGMWARALTSTEVAELYNGGAGLDYAGFGGAATSPISGTTSITLGATGALKGAGRMSGTTSLTFGATGTMKGAGKLSGTTTLTFAATGTGRANRFASGATSLTFGATGTLRGAGRLSGTTSLTFGVTGALLLPGAISGSTSMTFGASGTLAGAGALAGSTGIIFAASITVDVTVVWTSAGAAFYYEELKWGRYQFALEVFFKATTGTVHARLYNRTDAAEVDGAEVETDSLTYTRERAPAVSLADAKEYEVQFGKVGGGSAGEWKSARLIAS